MSQIVGNSRLKTTIEVKFSTLQMLSSLMGKKDNQSWDETIRKTMGREVDVFVDFIYVDGVLAKSGRHEIIFQIGDSPPRYFRYIDGRFDHLERLPQFKMLEVSN